VQSFDHAVQLAINRMQSFKETASAVDALRRVGICGVNVDLIYGLPHQTVASCVDTVLQCAELWPERLSIFGYAHVPSLKPHQRMIDAESLPDGLERYRQFEAMAATLRDLGYRRIGLDHFCLPDDPMNRAQEAGRLRRNFQGYTTDSADVLLGFGASAISQLAEGYVQNDTGARSYAARIAAGELAAVKGCALTNEDRLRSDIIERIMCDFRADVGRICAAHGTSRENILQTSARLRDLVANGVAVIDGTSLAVADDARFLVRSVAAAFDAHLEGSAMRHSRAV
jgi:oxygen-independent coproporphyrinogen-3 oxidase